MPFITASFVVTLKLFPTENTLAVGILAEEIKSNISVLSDFPTPVVHCIISPPTHLFSSHTSAFGENTILGRIFT